MDKKQEIIQRIYRTIQNANYYQFENGSLINLVDNFEMMYGDKDASYALRSLLKCRYRDFCELEAA